MNIQQTNNNTNFKQLKGIRLTGQYAQPSELRNVDRIVNSIRSNEVFQDIFAKRDGYIVLDKSIKTFNDYAANVSHVIENSLSITFDLNLGFFSRLLRIGRPPMLFNLIKINDYKCGWEGKDFNGDIENRFNYAIMHYDENQFIDAANSLRRANGDLIEDTPKHTNYDYEVNDTKKNKNNV